MRRIHEQLLAQSLQLAGSEPRRPLQASVRRATSAAYYALFHFVIEEIGRHLVGASIDGRDLRHALGRSLDHGTLKECFDRFLRTSAALPEALLRCLRDRIGPSDEMMFVAESFLELQSMRKRADYDLGVRITRPEAERAHWLAEQSILRWSQMRGTREAQVFAVAAVSWKGLRGR